MYAKLFATHRALIIIDLKHLIFFELGRVIDENACKELLNQIPVKKIAQQAQRESNADFKTKKLCFCHLINTSVLYIDYIAKLSKTSSYDRNSL